MRCPHARHSCCRRRDHPRGGPRSVPTELETLRTSRRRQITALSRGVLEVPADDSPTPLAAFKGVGPLEQRIAMLEHSLSGTRIAEPNGKDGAIGSVVRLHDHQDAELVEYTLTVDRLQVYWTISEINEMLADLGEPPTTLEELERAGVDVCPDEDES